jgi:hypothetical protein
MTGPKQRRTKIRPIRSLGFATAMAFVITARAPAARTEEMPSAANEPPPSVEDSAGHGTAPIGPAEGSGKPRIPTSTVEPSVEELCRAAVALAMAEPERARSFLSRARLAGWLPEMRFRVFRRFARTEGLTLDDSATTTPVDVSAVDDVRYEWRATWDLSRIVFNPEELQAHAEALRMADVRRDIQSLVVRLYFERRRLSIVSTGSDRSEGSPSTPRRADGTGADARRRLRIAEVEAQLEALTGRPFFDTDAGSAEARP